jgi:hypothetical protein
MERNPVSETMSNQKAEKRYLSFTQIAMFLRCPRQYEFRYIQGLKRPPSGALVLGKSWHSAVELNYRQKIQSGTDLPITDVTDCFSDTFDRAFTEEVELNEGEDKGQLKDMGIEITSLHHAAIAPKVQPLLVEQEFNLDLGPDFPYTLKGIWDVIERDGVIADNKSFSKIPTQSDLNKDIQLTAYATAYRAIYQKIEPGLRLDCVIKNKAPKAIRLHTKRSNDDCRWFLGLIEKVAQAIERGVFFPNPSSHLCNPRWCGYWDRCKK